VIQKNAQRVHRIFDLFRRDSRYVQKTCEGRVYIFGDVLGQEIRQCPGHLEQVQDRHRYLYLRLRRRLARILFERGPITEADAAVRGFGRDGSVFGDSGTPGITSTLMRPMIMRGSRSSTAASAPS